VISDHFNIFLVFALNQKYFVLFRMWRVITSKDNEQLKVHGIFFGTMHQT
jgi:hypothetical protein